MRIGVTGASGKLGSAVVIALSAEGHEVTGIDNRPRTSRNAHHIRVDLCKPAHAERALAGLDAVIHLAAIPAPTGRPADVVFSTNVLSTFNVFEAAATLGITRVVSASSVSALGFPWQHRWSEPLYVPIDEPHPLLSQDCYGLSKIVGEETAAAYCRRGAGSAASLRFSIILAADEIMRHVDAAREDPHGYAHLLWSYVDLRDAARACLLAATAPFEGHQPLYITAADTLSPLPTDQLLARSYPKVPRVPGGRPACWSVLAIERASSVIGYQPRHSWHDAD